MWSIEETEDELVIRAFPVLMWAMVAGCFVLGFLVAKIYVEAFGQAGIGALFEGGLGDGILSLLALTAFPLGGLVLFHLAPLVVTRFDGRTLSVASETYTLFGKRTRKFGFGALRGGVRVKAEENEGSTFHTLYFELESGEKVSLSKELSWRKGRVYDVARKANEFIQTKKRTVS